MTKYCIVPGCVSTSRKFPNKRFITVPVNETRRNLWMKAIRTTVNYSKTSNPYVCEDHFNLEEDAQNYWQLKFFPDSRIFLKKEVLPHIFKCQPHRTDAQPPKELQFSAVRTKKNMVESLLHSPAPSVSNNSTQISTGCFTTSSSTVTFTSAKGISDLFEEKMECYQPDPLAVNETAAVDEENIFLADQIKIEYPLEGFEHDSNTDFEGSSTKIKLEVVDHLPVFPIKQEKVEDDELSEASLPDEELILGLPGPLQSFETAFSVKEEECEAVINQNDEVKLETNKKVCESRTIVAEGQQTDPEASLQRCLVSEDHPLPEDLKKNLSDEIQKVLSENPFQCGICEKRFSNSSKLKIHDRKHTRGKLFQCDECGKRFTQKGYLKLHLRVHTGEKPFTCDQCQESFSHSTSLKNHLSVHLKEKPFKCDLCEKTFTLNSSLKNHQSVHTGEKRFECDVCEQKFTRSFTLKTHKRIHVGEKPFQCEHCRKGFTDIGTLKRHRRTHAEEKPFKCDQCEKEFSRNYTLKKHLRKHTGEEPKTIKCETTV